NECLRMCRKQGIPTDVAWSELALEQQRYLLEGDGKYYGVRGWFQWLETKTYKMHVRVFLSRYRSYDLCPESRGPSGRAEALEWQRAGQPVAEASGMSVGQAPDFSRALAPSSAQLEVATPILQEIRSRLGSLVEVGLGSLPLDRQSRTLSG